MPAQPNELRCQCAGFEALTLQVCRPCLIAPGRLGDNRFNIVSAHFSYRKPHHCREQTLSLILFQDVGLEQESGSRRQIDINASIGLANAIVSGQNLACGKEAGSHELLVDKSADGQKVVPGKIGKKVVADVECWNVADLYQIAGVEQSTVNTLLLLGLRELRRIQTPDAHEIKITYDIDTTINNGNHAVTFLTT